MVAHWKHIDEFSYSAIGIISSAYILNRWSAEITQPMVSICRLGAVYPFTR